MTKKTIRNLIILNLFIAIVDIITFSVFPFNEYVPSNNVLAMALDITVLVMSMIAFFSGNYSLLFQKPVLKIFGTSELLETDDLFSALDDCSIKKVFIESVSQTKNQLHRMNNKESSLETILSQYFVKGELTYVKFQNVIDSTKMLFLDNVKKIINRITIFDDIEYSNMISKYGADLDKYIDIDPKVKIYQEHISYVNTLVERNEDILTKLDALLLEISKLDDVDNSTFEQLKTMEDINTLISTTKYYKGH